MGVIFTADVLFTLFVCVMVLKTLAKHICIFCLSVEPFNPQSQLHNIALSRSHKGRLH